MDVDGWGAYMSDAVVMGFLDDVGVVASSFDDAGVGSISAVCGSPFVDFG